MWRESVIKIADDMGALSCAVVPVHPWVYGVGQLTESGGYLSPANALGYLAKKLAVSGGRGDVIVMMIADDTHDIFMRSLDNLASVFPAPAFTQVRRMAAAAAELAAVKMQLPSKADLLPAAAPLSVATNRLAVNAQRVAAALRDAAAPGSPDGMITQVAGFVQERASALASLSQSLNDLTAASANALSFRFTGSHRAAAVELLKDIPRATAVHTAAMMFIGDSLDELGKIIHEPDSAVSP